MSKKDSSNMSKPRNWISENLIFAWRYLKSPKEVGTPFPCSAAVAKSILKHIPPEKKKDSYHYLEVGPGTGAFTEEFIKKLRPQDRLDLVEIDEGFCKVLKTKYRDIPNVHIHHMPIEQWNPPYKYDAIVSAVPLNALPSEETLKSIFSSYLRLIEDHCILSSVEYIGTSTLRKNFLYGDKKSKFEDLLKLKAKFYEKYGLQKEIVWQNLPPARITHYKISK